MRQDYYNRCGEEAPTIERRQSGEISPRSSIGSEPNRNRSRGSRISILRPISQNRSNCTGHLSTPSTPRLSEEAKSIGSHQQQRSGSRPVRRNTTLIRSRRSTISPPRRQRAGSICQSGSVLSGSVHSQTKKPMTFKEFMNKELTQ